MRKLITGLLYLLFLIPALSSCSTPPPATPSPSLTATPVQAMLATASLTLPPTASFTPQPTATFTSLPTDTATAIPSPTSTLPRLPTLPSPTPYAGSPQPPTVVPQAAFPTPIAKTYFRLTLVNESGQPVIFKLESLFQPGRGYLFRLSPGQKLTAFIAAGNYQSTTQACGVIRSAPADISANARLVFAPCP